MNLKDKAFTLTELLVAIGIIGAIAAMSIPSMVTRFQNKMFVTKLKSTVEAIRTLAEKQKTMSITGTLSSTDFDYPERLLTSKNFNIVSHCEPSSTECWKTIKYKTINDTSTATYERQTDIYTAKLKDGSTIGYMPSNYHNYSIGLFIIDLNGDDLPNIVGRDLFGFYISPQGSLNPIPPSSDVGEEGIDYCKEGYPSHCYGLILRDGWKMKY